MRRLFPILAVTASLLAGCGPGESASGPGQQNAKTPEAAVVNLAKATLASDLETYVACFDAADAQRPLLEALFAFIQANHAFRKRLIAAYPDQKDTIRELDFGLMTGKSLLTTDADELLRAGQVAVDKRSSSLALFSMAGPPQQTRIVKKGEFWYIDASSILPDGAKAEAMERMTAALGKATARIGTPGVTPRSLARELAEARGTLPAPEPL